MTNESRHISESYGQRVLRLAFSGMGARLGLMWVLLLVFAATFAPYIANSMPLIASENGEISFPVLRYTTAEDILLLTAFFSGLILWRMPLNFIKKLWIFTLLIVVLSIGAKVLLTPPKLIIYDEFREKVTNAEYDWVILPAIPYEWACCVKSTSSQPIDTWCTESALATYIQRESGIGRCSNGA